MQGVPDQHDHTILTASNWVATPGDYSSSRWLRFAANGTGEAIFGYGQTIYARVLFDFVLVAGPVMKVVYRKSPTFGSFKGLDPIPDEPARTIGYSLSSVIYSGIESVTGFSFVCNWLLTLAESPWPLDMSFPRPIPTEFYGYRVRTPRLKP